MHWQNKNRKCTPPLLTLRRAKSARELFRPAIKDLSEQAAWTASCQDLGDDSFIQSIGAPNVSINRGDEENKTNKENGLGQVENNSYLERSNTHICLNTKINSGNNETNKRLPYSAANRLRLLSTFKRPRSVDSYIPSPRSIPYPDNNYSYQSLLVTNASSPMNTARQDYYNKRKCHLHRRPLIRTVSQSGSLLSDGFTGQKNGFHEYLISTHPQVKQKISSWMTNGFKVQSINLRNTRKTTSKPSCSSGKLRKAAIDRKTNHDICPSSICIQGNAKM